MRELAQDPRSVPLVRLNAIIFLSCLTIIGASACTRSGGDSGIVQFELERVEDDGAIALRDFRFYIHDIELLDQQGRASSFRLLADSEWQDETVGLIDLVGSSEEDRHVELRGTVAKPPETYAGIRFKIGVPFKLNHADPLKASAPLDRGDMLWSWQSGYKFLRVDLMSESGERSFHLGSTGCASASAVRPPGEPCAQPNLMQVELRGFEPLREPVRVRVSELIESLRAPGSGTCTGGYAYEPACASVFVKTGLDPATGICAGRACRDQTIFVSP